jgi:hypothetical protein
LPFSTDQEWTLINPQLVLIPLVPQLMKRVDPRIVIGIGFALFAASNFLNISMTNDYAADQLLWPNVVRAVGRALRSPPLGGRDCRNRGGERRVRDRAVQHDAQISAAPSALPHCRRC